MLFSYLSVTALSAQKFNIGLNVHAAFSQVTEINGNTSSSGTHANYLGFGLEGNYAVGAKSYIGLQTGYSGEIKAVGTIAIVPVLAKFTYEFTETKLRPYATLSAGYYWLGRHYFHFRDSNNGFGFSPQAGIHYNFSKGISLNADFRYAFIRFKANSYGNDVSSPDFYNVHRYSLEVGLLVSLGK